MFVRNSAPLLVSKYMLSMLVETTEIAETDHRPTIFLIFLTLRYQSGTGFFCNINYMPMCLYL